jgi:hypothetical protein
MPASSRPAVASEILGVSGRAMLEALIADDDPAALADLDNADAREDPELTEALSGRFSEHHAAVPLAQTRMPFDTSVRAFCNRYQSWRISGQ